MPVRQVVTYDASPAAGASEHCRENTRRLFEALLDSGKGLDWGHEVADAFGLCSAPETAAELEQVALWIQV